MKVLVDGDLASRALLQRLELSVADGVLAPDRPTADDQVWHRAQAEGAAVLTGNAVDFLALVRESTEHYGLLLVCRSNDRANDLRAADIARRIEEIIHRFPEVVAGRILAVNGFARSTE